MMIMMTMMMLVITMVIMMTIPLLLPLYYNELLPGPLHLLRFFIVLIVRSFALQSNSS